MFLSSTVHGLSQYNKMLILAPHIPPHSSFCFSKITIEFTVIHPLNIYQHAFCGHMLTASTLQPPQKFERPPFWNGQSYDIKNMVSWSPSMS
jgi:hypothetical protein